MPAAWTPAAPLRQRPCAGAACASNRSLQCHELAMEWAPLPCGRAHPFGARTVEYQRDRIASPVQFPGRFQGVGDPSHVGVGLGIRQRNERHTGAQVACSVMMLTPPLSKRWSSDA